LAWSRLNWSKGFRKIHNLELFCNVPSIGQQGGKEEKGKKKREEKQKKHQRQLKIQKAQMRKVKVKRRD